MAESGTESPNITYEPVATKTPEPPTTIPGIDITTETQTKDTKPPPIDAGGPVISSMVSTTSELLEAAIPGASLTPEIRQYEQASQPSLSQPDNEDTEGLIKKPEELTKEAIAPEIQAPAPDVTPTLPSTPDVPPIPAPAVKMGVGILKGIMNLFGRKK